MRTHETTWALKTLVLHVPAIGLQKAPSSQYFRCFVSSLKVWPGEKPHRNIQSSEYQPQHIVKRQWTQRTHPEQFCAMLDLPPQYIHYSNLLSLLDSSLLSWNGHQAY